MNIIETFLRGTRTVTDLEESREQRSTCLQFAERYGKKKIAEKVLKDLSEAHLKDLSETEDAKDKDNTGRDLDYIGHHFGGEFFYRSILEKVPEIIFEDNSTFSMESDTEDMSKMNPEDLATTESYLEMTSKKFEIIQSAIERSFGTMSTTTSAFKNLMSLLVLDDMEKEGSDKIEMRDIKEAIKKLGNDIFLNQDKYVEGE
jgi:hypothetical protein